jgi:hypothetical protein
MGFEERNSPNLKGPVFVVGMNGSGTTMLLECLGRHPSIYSFPGEIKALPRLIRYGEEIGNLENDEVFLKLLDRIRNAVVFKITEGGEVPLPSGWERLDRNFGSAFDAVMKHFADKEEKKRWCEKSPKQALHISSLAEHFPGSSFIHLIRDGRDCAQSLHRRWKYNPYRTIYVWKKLIRSARRQGSSLPGRYIEVRYEELSTEPATVMKKICDFINIEFLDSMLLSSGKHLDPRFRKDDSSDYGIKKNIQKWKAYFSEKEIAKLERISGELLDELGYEILTGRYDRDPGFIRTNYWLIIDSLKTARGFIRYINDRSSLKVMSRKFKDLIDQYIITKY